MKKLTTLMLALGSVLVALACGSSNSDVDGTTGATEQNGGNGVGSYTTLLKEYFPNATVLESLGISGASIRDASSRQTVENWLKKLGVDKQSTAIRSVNASMTRRGRRFALNGQPTNGQSGIYIQDGKKYIGR